jgi:pyruvate/2-oxoglutarate dehydrogenase complex dihydrolipoamide dehydrogenase (E3) component
MPQPERFEILVLGSGNGGMFLAWHMARSGRRTAVVERRLIGGSCPTRGACRGRNVARPMRPPRGRVTHW